MSSERAVLSRALFEVTRPSPVKMAELIKDGVSVDDIINVGVDQGYSGARVKSAQRDIETLLPYIATAVGELRQTSSADTLLFAARDAEPLYDYYVTSDASTADVHLLPASMGLFFGPTMRSLGAKWLEGFGLSRKEVLDGTQKFTLVDTGFKGSVLIQMDRIIRDSYGMSLRNNGRMAVRLVCAGPDAVGGQMIADDFYEEITPSQLPHAVSAVGYQSFARTLEVASPANVVAAAIQTLPHYHSPFDRLVEEDGKINAVSSARNVTMDGPNASIVDPLAAAVVQHRVVSEAMGHER